MKLSHEILKVARLEPTKIYVYTAEDWKWELFRVIKDLPDKDKIREAMKLRKDKSTVEFVKQVIKVSWIILNSVSRKLLSERKSIWLTSSDVK